LEKFHGTGVALVTPFDANLVVDYKGLKRLLEFTAADVDYFVVQGTTGESTTTTAKEKTDILEFVRSNNVKNLPIVYGIGGNNTVAVVESIKQTNLDGVSAILSVSPYYNKPTQEGIYQHYVKIADNSPVPVILYNVPGRTMSNITAETTIRLAEHRNIIGIKEASGDLEQCKDIMTAKPTDFILISGDDMLTTDMMSIGAKGVISVLANGFPEIFRRITHAAINNNIEESRIVTESLSGINPLMYSESNPVGIKEVLNQKGVCGNEVRLPLLAASQGLIIKINLELDRF
jgi:4-hydroxy-tetrahydrodipicolinate synthase